MLNPKNRRMDTINALVTGSNGFIGGLLVKYLVGEGYTVHCFLRQERRSSTQSSE
jgi:nucleoside-diphosphate-sugar epimerase